MADGDFLNRAYQFFISKGYSPHAAAALAAQGKWESGGNPLQVHDQGTGFGLYGWRDPKPGEGRKTALYKWAADNHKDPESEQTQLEFADHELQTSEAGAGQKLKDAKDYKEATDATLAYLRPQNYSAQDPGSSHGYVGRFNNGAQLAGVDPIAVAPVGAPQTVGPGAASNPAMAQAPQAPYAPPPSLLAPSSNSADLLAAQQAGAKAKAQDDLYAGLAKTGTGLLGQAETPGTPFMQASAQPHRPQVQPVGMPDFTQILAQQRLMRGT